MAVDPRKSHPFRVERLYVGTAVDLHELHLEGHFLRVRETSRPGVFVNVAINRPDTRNIPLKEGQGWKHLPFSTLFFSWTAQDDNGTPDWLDIEVFGNPHEAKPDEFGTFTAVDATNVEIQGTANVAVTNTPTVNVGTMPTVSVQPAAAAASRQYVPIQKVNNDTVYADVYTVPANKVLKLERLVLTHSGTGTVTSVEVFDGAQVHEWSMAAATNEMVTFDFSPPIELAATDKIRAKASSGTGNYYVNGQAYLEDV